MNLLFPAMLAGLAGLSIPIALHLIAKNRFPVVKIPSIRFLQAERRENVFAWQIVDLPQLLLRLLLILLLVLVMARLFTPWLSASPAPRNVMVVIDASASMRTEFKTETGRESSFARAQAEAVRLLETITAPSRCGVIEAGAATVQRQDLRPDVAGAIAEVNAITPCDGAGPGLVPAVVSACELLRGRREVRNQVVVYTDLRASAFTARQQNDLAAIARIQEEMGDSLEIVIVDVSDSKGENTAILDARVRSGEVKMGDDAHVVARIANFGTEDVTVAPRLEIDGRKEPATTERVIAPGGEIVVDVTSPMNRVQRTFAQISVDSKDALTHDNTFDLPLLVADSRRVLIVNGDASERAPEGANRLEGMGGGGADKADATPDAVVDGSTILRYALNPGRELGLTVGTGIVPTVVTPEGLAGQALSKYDMIILYDVSSLPEKTLGDLDVYVKQGRAIVIFAAKHLNPMQFNRTLAAGSGERAALSPAPIGNDLTLEAPVSLAHDAINHPVLSPFAEQRSGDLSAIRFVQLRELRLDDASAKVMFRDDTGRPLAVEKRIQQGRVVLFAFGVELERGNLARTRVFPPMLWRLTDYMTGQVDRTPDVPMAALRPMVMDVREPQFAFVESLELSPASGQSEDLPTSELAKSAADTVLVDSLPAGRYQLHKPRLTPDALLSYTRLIAVNADRGESDMTVAERPLLKEIFGDNVQVLTSTDTASLIPKGGELASILALLLLLAYVVEAVVGWWLSAKREQERTTGETP